jgi:hypothetical protein
LGSGEGGATAALARVEPSEHDWFRARLTGTDKARLHAIADRIRRAQAAEERDERARAERTARLRDRTDDFVTVQRAKRPHLRRAR